MQNNFVALHQFDGSVNLLKIELLTSDRYLISAEGVGREKIAFGIFETEKDKLESDSVALLATPDGPLLFLKNRQYIMKFGETKVEIKDEGKFSYFHVYDKNNCIFSLFYKEKFGIGLHPYNNDREDIDFYYWLEKQSHDPDFYKCYTRKIICTD